MAGLVMVKTAPMSMNVLMAPMNAVSMEPVLTMTVVTLALVMMVSVVMDSIVLTLMNVTLIHVESTLSALTVTDHSNANVLSVMKVCQWSAALISMNVSEKLMSAMKMPPVLTMLVATPVPVMLVSKVLDVIAKISMSAKLVTTLALVLMPCARTYQEHMTVVVQTDITWMLLSFQVVSSPWDAQMPMNALFTVITATEIMVSVTILLVVGNVNVPLVGNLPRQNFSPLESVSMMVKPVSILTSAPEVHSNVIQMQLVLITPVVTLVNVTLDSPVTVNHAWTSMNVPDVCWLDQTLNHVMSMLSVPTHSVVTLVPV